jgi:hypothetical protein
LRKVQPRLAKQTLKEGSSFSIFGIHVEEEEEPRAFKRREGTVGSCFMQQLRLTGAERQGEEGDDPLLNG